MFPSSFFSKQAAFSFLICLILPSVTNADPTPAIPEEGQETAHLAAAHFAAREWQQAAKAYQKVLELDPENTLTRANLAQAFYRMDQWDLAIFELETVTKQDPSMITSWITLGLCYQKTSRPYAAIAAFSSAVDAEPENAVAHQFLGVAMHQNGWTIAAQTELQRALQIDPNYATAHFNLATIYLHTQPPALNLAKRHYLYSLETGGEKDAQLEEILFPQDPTSASTNSEEPTDTNESE